MLHLGSPEFYRAVRRQLERCDVVVVEGVGGRTASVITLAYRIGGRVRRDGLVDQGEGLDLTGLEGRIVRPDLTAAQFASGWRKISRRSRWLFLAAAPVLGVWLAIAGPRRVLGRDLGMDDLPTREEEEMSDVLPGLDEAFLGDRDRALCHELERLAADTGTAATVGVCWGAAHMRAVIALLLSRLGYRLTDATWITVF
jgi:hypothetical protein